MAEIKLPESLVGWGLYPDDPKSQVALNAMIDAVEAAVKAAYDKFSERNQGNMVTTVGQAMDIIRVAYKTHVYPALYEYGTQGALDGAASKAAKDALAQLASIFGFSLAI